MLILVSNSNDHQRRICRIRPRRIGLAADHELVYFGIVQLRRLGLKVRWRVHLFVNVASPLQAAGLALHLGPADDESWTWLNGKFLGEVTKKTNPKDYWAFARKHAIGPGLLKRDGENVLVVLVNDTFQTGGLTGTPTLAAPGAWLNGYYVQQPVADDDPYRYFRW